MTLFINHITTPSSLPSSPPSSPSAADAGQIGTQILPRTLRERRGVTWFIHIEPYTLAGYHDDKGSAQPKGHLQPTVMNVPRRRRMPGKAAPVIHNPTPLSSPCTSSSPSIVVDCEGTQNHLRTPCERLGETLSVNLRAKIEEWRRGVLSPEWSSRAPLLTGSPCCEVLSPDTLVSPSLFSPRAPPSDSTDSDVELNGRQPLPRSLRERRGVIFSIHFEPRELVGWPKQRGPQHKGRLEPTVINVPRRHNRVVYGPMIHSRLPCNFY